MGNLLWDDGTMPSIFSAFLVLKQQEGLLFSTKDHISLSLKILDGSSGLNEKDLERLMKVQIFLPDLSLTVRKMRRAHQP